MMEKISREVLTQRAIGTTLLVILIILCYSIIEFFIVPALWAAIISYMTMPLYNLFQTKAKFSPNLSAASMTMVVAFAIGCPMLVGVYNIHQEAFSLYNTIINRIKYGYLDAPTAVKQLPLVGLQIEEALKTANADPDGTILKIKSWVRANLYYGKVAADIAFSFLAKFGITVLTLFFFYRDGNLLVNQIRQALIKVVGRRIDSYIESIRLTTQAVVYGIGLTALVQAALAGIGYHFSGAPNPLFLMVLTFMISLIPFGTPFVWGSVAIWLLIEGNVSGAIGLALWGACVISWVDNVIRPIVISGATEIPFIIIFFGVLGGLSAFGFVGLFIGPVVLAIALSIWKEWVAKQKRSVLTRPRKSEKSIDTLSIDEDTEENVTTDVVTPNASASS